jgi:hypothetical protein
VHDIKPTDASQRIKFCNLVLKNVHDGLTCSQLLFITDEAYFHLSGCINSENTCIWSDENPHAVHQIPQHDIQIGVLFAEVLGELLVQ